MVKSKLNGILQNNLVKSVLVVAGGTAGAQAIGLLFIPFITRIYGPEIYGVLGVFISLSSVLTTLAALAYPVAIVLPESDKAAKALIKLSILISMIISSTVLIVFLLGGKQIITILGIESLSSLVFFIPLVMFIASLQDIAQQWLIRKKQFKGIASVSMIHAFINQGLQVLAGLHTPLANVLIGIYTIAITIRTVLTSYIGKRISSVSKNEVELSVSLKKIAYQYRDFPFYRAPQVILNSASQSLPILMLTAFFGPAYAGFYTLTRTVLGLPSTLLGSSVQSVFYPHFNQAVLSKVKTFPIITKATVALAVIGVWPFLIVILFGPFLFGLVFGEEWRQAGQYAQWLSFWLFFNMINRPSISSIPIFRMQKWFLYYEFLSIIFRAIGIYIGFFYFTDALAAVAVFSVISAFLSIIIMVKMFFVSINFDKDLIS